MRALPLALTALLLGACANTAPDWQLGRVDRLSPAQAAALPPVVISAEQKAALDRLDAQILADQENAVARQAYERALYQAVQNWSIGVGYGGGWGWGGYPGYWGRPGWSVGWGWYLP